jgi:hypothetical protein
MHKEIPLSNGGFTVVDDKDYEFISGWKWYRRPDGYAATTVKIGKSQKFLHKFLMPTDPGQEVDHINRNKLDNRRDNLRYVTKQQNQMNQGVQKRSKSSTFKGVTYHGKTGKWRAYIKKDGKGKFLGVFKTEIEAAKAYDQKALELFGQYAGTNFQEVLQ